MMIPGHGRPLDPGGTLAARERRQAKEITRRAVEEQDVPMAVYGWLELSVCHYALHWMPRRLECLNIQICFFPHLICGIVLWCN